MAHVPRTRVRYATAANAAFHDLRYATVKALSIQQPWAYCITTGTKRVENRTWFASYRGPLLIHAGKKYQTGMEYDIYRDSPEVDPVGMKRSPRGAIVGVCRLVACVRETEVAADQRIWAGGPWCFVLADVREIEPIPYKGALGFFDIPDAVLNQEREVPGCYPLLTLPKSIASNDC